VGGASQLLRDAGGAGPAGRPVAVPVGPSRSNEEKTPGGRVDAARGVLASPLMTTTDEFSPRDADILVVGAGIAGLAAAHRLRERGLSTVLIDPEQHTGGRIRTERHDGAYLEHGGIFHTEGYPALRALFAAFGLDGDVVATESGFHTAVRHGAGWAHVDYGSLVGPLRFPALRWADRLSILRAALPALRARPSDLGDLTTLAHLDDREATAGLSAKAASHFTAGPHEFLWGVPSERLSFAMLAMQLKVFTGELRELRGGIGRLIEALAAGLDVRHGAAAERVEETADGVTVHVANGAPVTARAAVLACPADVSRRIWPDAPPAVAAHLAAVDYSRIDYVYLRTRDRLRLSHRGRPVGMEVVTTPEVGAMTMGGIYLAHGWAERDGLLLVTAAPAAGAAELADTELADRIQADVEKLHPQVVGQVTDRVVMRHHPYTPTFGVGSVRRAAAARCELPHRRVDLAGDHMTAPWVEGAVRSGQLAADRIAATLTR
jgi:protoporphyrinogen/coproporphyrinogen III oxidase